MPKLFWIHVDMNDYRSGTNIYTFEKPHKEDEEDDYSAPEEAVMYSFPIPENYRIYIVSEFPHYRIVSYVDALDKDECNKLYLKMYSQIYNCLPFELTGYNVSYKEDGYYPEITDDIKNMVDIDVINEIKKENIEYANVYFAFAIDKNGNELFTKML